MATKIEVKELMVRIGDEEMPLEVKRDTEITVGFLNKEVIIEPVFDEIISGETSLVIDDEDGTIELIVERKVLDKSCAKCRNNGNCTMLDYEIKKTVIIGDYVRDIEIEEDEEDEEGKEVVGMVDMLADMLAMDVAKSIMDELEIPTSEEVTEVMNALENKPFLETVVIIPKVLRIMDILNNLENIEGKIANGEGLVVLDMIQELEKAVEIFREIQSDLGLEKIEDKEIVLQDLIVEENINVLEHLDGKLPIKPYCTYRNRKTLKNGVVRTEVLNKHDGEILAFGECTLEETNGDLGKAEVISSYRSRMNYIQFSMDSFVKGN